MRCLAGYVSSVHVQLITVWDAQVGRKLCGCMANGMKNAMKHNVNKGMMPFPRRGLICASQVSIGIASCCLPRNLASCLSLHCTIPHFLFFPQVIHNNTTLKCWFPDIRSRWLPGVTWASGLVFFISRAHCFCCCGTWQLDYTLAEEVLSNAVAREPVYSGN